VLKGNFLFYFKKEVQHSSVSVSEHTVPSLPSLRVLPLSHLFPPSFPFLPSSLSLPHYLTSLALRLPAAAAASRSRHPQSDSGCTTLTCPPLHTTGAARLHLAGEIQPDCKQRDRERVFAFVRVVQPVCHRLSREQQSRAREMARGLVHVLPRVLQSRSREPTVYSPSDPCHATQRHRRR
jgi:hypothetical protein